MSYIYRGNQSGERDPWNPAWKPTRRRYSNGPINLTDTGLDIAEAEALATHLRRTNPEDEQRGVARLKAATAEAYGRAA